MNAERRFIVDANVVVKWFVAEEGSSQARSLLPDTDLIAPRFLLIEAGSVFLKKMRLGGISEGDLARALASMLQRLDFRDESDYYELALTIAHAHGRSFYDSVYVALALQERRQLVSADERLCNALRPHFGETMLWLGDVPAV